MTPEQLFELISGKFPEAHSEAVPFAVLLELIESRERKAFDLAIQRVFYRLGTVLELSEERFLTFEDYKASDEYKL